LAIQLSGMGWLVGLTPPHICVCPKQGHGFPVAYVVVISIYTACW